jgi:hypothetical protein
MAIINGILEQKNGVFESKALYGSNSTLGMAWGEAERSSEKSSG